jgi:hypothetical protein
VKIDLKDLRLVPSWYSVKAHGAAFVQGSHFVPPWRFDGSDDGSKWEVLDSHTDSGELMGNDKEASFAISAVRTFRFLPFIQTGANSFRSRYFCLQRLEIFGQLQRNPE